MAVSRMRGEKYAIIRLFMAESPKFPHRNFKFLTVGRVKRVELYRLVNIGQTMAEIRRFFDFSSWRPPPCWIFEISNF